MTERVPNLLVIVTDQQTATAMSCAGNEDLQTPAMDALAEQGLRFERAYCPHPLCGPSRASLVTGWLPHVHGATANGAPIREEAAARSLGLRLGGAGYRCALAGKWHVPGVTPEAMGFEELGCRRDAEVPAAAEAFMQKEPDRPFLLLAAFRNPHDVCQAARSQPLPEGPVPEPASIADCPGLPANFAEAPYAPDVLRLLRESQPRVHPTVEFAEDDWRRLRYTYFRLVEKVDAEIGRLMAALHRLGIEEDTVVILTADHGEGAGAHRWNQKTALYEEVIRVPLIVSRKGRTPAGVDREHTVSAQLDAWATCCALAGLDVESGPDSGRSLWPMAEGRTPTDWREAMVTETQFALGAGAGGLVRGRALHAGACKYSVYSMGRYREQLVDLETDPGEMVNLSVQARHRATLDRCRAMLRGRCEATEDPFFQQCR